MVPHEKDIKVVAMANTWGLICKRFECGCCSCKIDNKSFIEPFMFQNGAQPCIMLCFVFERKFCFCLQVKGIVGMKCTKKKGI